MGRTSVREEDLIKSACCGEKPLPVAEFLGSGHIKVKHYCSGCLKVLKVHIRAVKERRTNVEAIRSD